MDPSLSAIIMIIIQLLATATSSSLVDRIGRRILYILSSGGTALGMTAMGTYVYLSFMGADLSGFDWVPVTSLSFAVLSCNIGLIPLVFVVLLEVLPAKVLLEKRFLFQREMLTTLVSDSNCCCNAMSVVNQFLHVFDGEILSNHCGGS